MFTVGKRTFFEQADFQEASKEISNFTASNDGMLMASMYCAAISERDFEKMAEISIEMLSQLSEGAFAIYTFMIMKSSEIFNEKVFDDPVLYEKLSRITDMVESLERTINND